MPAVLPASTPDPVPPVSPCTCAGGWTLNLLHSSLEGKKFWTDRVSGPYMPTAAASSAGDFCLPMGFVNSGNSSVEFCAPSCLMLSDASRGADEEDVKRVAIAPVIGLKIWAA